jgi:RHS repeat-associated protein
MPNSESTFRSIRQLFLRVCLVFTIICALSATSRGQDASSYLFQTGQPSFGAVDKFPGGSVDLSNGNLHIEIPLAGPPQRGSLPVSLKLVYDSRLIWAVASSSQGSFWTTTQNSFGSSGGLDGHIAALGWRIVGNPEAVQVDNWSYSTQITCSGSTSEVLMGRYRWLGPDGHIHLFNVSGSPHCVPGGAAMDAYATDASGLHLFNFESGVTKIYARDGTLVYADPTPVYSGQTELSCTWIPEDVNGNFQTWTIQGSYCPQETGLSSTGGFFPTSTDTLGRQSITVTISGNVTVQAPNSQNSTSSTFIQMASHGSLFTAFEGINSSVTDCNAPPHSPCQYPNGAVQSITLPDGSQYTFTYDCSPSSYNNGSPAICSSPGGSLVPVYGLMTSMTLPTGGTVNFSYTNFTDSSPSFFHTNRWLTGVSYGGGQWSYTPATGCGNYCQTVTVARPSGAHEVYTFDTSTGTAALNTSIQYFSGAATGTPALAIQNVFESYGPTNVCLGGPACMGFSHLKTSTITVPAPSGNLMSQTAYLFDSFPDSSGSTVTTGKLLSKSEYAFGLGTVGSLARKTIYSYLDDANPNYRTPGAITGPCPLYGTLQSGICVASAANFMDRVVDQLVQDGSGNTVAETKTTYDSTPIANVSGIQNHDDPNFGTTNTIRGNPTQVQKLVSGSTFITTATASYDTTGQMTSLQDGNANVTSFIYLDSFFTDNTTIQNPPPSFTALNPTNAYLTQATLPIIGAAKYRYYYGTGKPAFSIDQNGADSYSHYLDALDRPTHLFGPVTNGNRSWALATYVPGGTQFDGYAAITDTSASVSCVSCQHARQNSDTFGRPILSTLVKDPDGPAMIATTYDSSGRTHTVSNPYRSTSDPTYGLTTLSFDVLGRPTLATEPDNSTVQIYYGADVTAAGGAAAQLCSPTTYGYGYPILKVDEATKKRQSWADAFGRTIEVDEPDSTGTLSLATCYTYNTVDNLTKVEQKGGSTDPTQWRTRTFNYDSLSRLTSATEPESGTTMYAYDPNGNLLTKTSPTGIATNAGGGSATVGGSEQNIPSSPATAGSGSVTFSGALQSKQLTHPATPGAGSISISGGPDQSTSVSYVCGPNGQLCWRTVYDSGSISVTVNGFTASATYYQASGTGSIATDLVTALNASGSPVTASSGGSGVSMTAKVTGAASNYSVSISVSYDSHDFSHSSFTATGPSALTGGTNATSTTVYDSGTDTITVNGHADTVSWSGSGTTTSSIASALASSINADSAASVSASASGGTVNLTAKATGASTNYSLSSSSTYDSADFTSPSFTTSNSGSALTGGQNAVATTYDSGSVWITVNGVQTSVSYGQNSTAATLASSLASSINANTSSSVTASSSGATVIVVAKTAGSTSDYSFSSGSSGAFSPPSFTVSASGATLTGGTDSSSQTVTISYCYDALNRPTAKAYTYSPNTPPTCSGTPPTFPSPVATYLYDQTAFNGLTITNGVGRRTGMTDAAGSEAWSYDAQGNVLADRRTTSGVTKTTSGTYNLDGSLATLTYPSGRIVTYTTGTAGRPVSAIDTANSINYAMGAHYSPPGDLASIQNSASIVSTYIFNSRLQPCWLYATTGTSLSWNSATCSSTATPANILDLKLNLNLGAADNGNVMGVTNNRDNTRSQNFTYDILNRLTSAQTQTSGVTIPNSNCWGLTFGYDPWGNLMNSSTTGPAGCSEPLALNVFVAASNRINGLCYDASGNLLDQAACPSGAHAYSYNAENQLAAAAGVTYTYDGDGKRVQKSSGMLYWYGMGSDPLDETDLAGSTANTSFHEYIFFGGQRIARRDSSNNVSYYFADHLGTSRIVTNSSGNILDDSDFYPFGGERPVTSSSSNTYKFTGYERDAESGLDSASARHYSSNLGRFMSTDPLSGTPGNPQSWNRYSYVYNNPLNATDPSGLCAAPDFDSDDPDCDPDSDGGGTAPVSPPVWTLHYSYDSGYSDLFNYSYAGPLVPGTGQYYPDDGSYFSRMMNEPGCPSCRIFNSAYAWVKTGTIVEGSLTGIAFAAPAIASIPGGIAYAHGGAKALLGPTGGYVLGSWPTYTRLAAAYGYAAYNLAPRFYNFYQSLQAELAANQGYIDMQVFLGRQGYIWEQESSQIPATRTLWWELQYLGRRGVDLTRIPKPDLTWPNVSR